MSIIVATRVFRGAKYFQAARSFHSNTMFKASAAAPAHNFDPIPNTRNRWYTLTHPTLTRAFGRWRTEAGKKVPV